MCIIIVFYHIKINTAVTFVSITFVKQCLHYLYLFDNVSCCMRLYIRAKNIHRVHCVKIFLGVELSNLHRLQLFQSCLFLNLIFTTIAIVLQMSDIGNVSYISYFVSQKFKKAVNRIESQSRSCVSQVSLSVNGWSANIHSYKRIIKWLKFFFIS